MRLPDRLDYIETNDGEINEPPRNWWPQVFCREPACPWLYDATWSDLGEDGDVNWDTFHRAHSS